MFSFFIGDHRLLRLLDLSRVEDLLEFIIYKQYFRSKTIYFYFYFYTTILLYNFNNSIHLK